MATYKGKTCSVIKRNNGKKKTVTVRFNGTGSEMTIPASRLSTRSNAKKKNPVRRNAKKKNPSRKNPYLAFGKHQGRKAKVTFFSHRTRASKPYKRGEKAPAGYSVIGTRAYASKAAYAKAQKARARKVPVAKRKAAMKRVRSFRGR